MKAEVGTIHLEEKQNPNGNKEQTTAREYSPSQLGLESIHNNYLRPNSKLKINGRTTSNPGIDQRLLNPNEIKEGKYSVSPINNISNTNNAGNALNKKRGEVVDMKASTSNFKKNTVKDKQFTVKNANDDLMKKSTSNKFSTVTTNMNKLGSTIKGYHIKNFSEAIKASNKHSSNAYSDRLSHKFVGMK